MIGLDIFLQEERTYVKYFDSRLKNSSLYIGWVELKSGEPVDKKGVKNELEKVILAQGQNLLVLQTPNQKFIAVGIEPCPYLVNKLAEARSARRLSNVQEWRFPDFTANANLEGHQG